MKSRRQPKGRLRRFFATAFSPKYRVFSYVVIFALIGGAIYLGTSFAASTPIAYLKNGLSTGKADITFAFGDKGDVPVACNWDGDGADGFGVRRPGNVTFYLSETLTPTKVTKTLQYGNIGDIPICGDWDGDKKAGVGVYRPENQTFYLSNKIEPNAKITKVKFGQKGDIPLACDWNGDGKTDLGLYRPSNAHFYLSYKKLGQVDDTIHFGDAGDQPVCGDWNGDKKAGIGVHRPSNAKFYLSNGNVQRTSGSGASEKTITNGKRQWNVNYEFVYGNGRGQQVFAGDWNGDGKDSVAIYRMGTLSESKPAAPTQTSKPGSYICVGTTVKELKDRKECIALLNYAYAGYPNLILQQIAVSENANKGGPRTTAPIPQPANPAPAPTPPAPVGTPTLRFGSTGEAVSVLQTKLGSFGYWIGATGDFNDLTDTVVRDFQSKRGIASDGIVGPQTWGHIAGAEAEGWRVSGLGENPQAPAPGPGNPPRVPSPAPNAGTCYGYDENGTTAINIFQNMTRDVCAQYTLPYLFSLSWNSPNRHLELLWIKPDDQLGRCIVYGHGPNFPVLNPTPWGQLPPRVTRAACNSATKLFYPGANHTDWDGSGHIYQVWPTYFKR